MRVEFSETEEDDAVTWAALTDRFPIHDSEKRAYRILSRNEVVDLANKLQSQGHIDESYRLLSSLDFDGIQALKSRYPRIRSRSVRISAGLMYKLVERVRAEGVTRNDIVREALIPRVAKEIDAIKKDTKLDRLRIVLDQMQAWREIDLDTNLREGRPPFREDQRFFRSYLDNRSVPFLRSDLAVGGGGSGPSSALHRFRKALLRMCTIDPKSMQMRIGPSIMEKYIDMVIPLNQTMPLEISPAESTLRLYFTGHSRIHLDRTETDQEDFENRLTFLIVLRSQMHGFSDGNLYTSERDEQSILESILSRRIEEWSQKGPITLDEIRNGVKQIHGIEWDFFGFPSLNQYAEIPIKYEVNQNWLLFPLSLKSDGTFSIEHADVRKDNMASLRKILKERIETYTQAVLGEVWNAVENLNEDRQPIAPIDLDRLKRESSSDYQKEVVTRMAVREFRESIEDLSESLALAVTRYLTNSQVLTFTCPSIMLTFANKVMEATDMEAILQGELAEGAK